MQLTVYHEDLPNQDRPVREKTGYGHPSDVLQDRRDTPDQSALTPMLVNVQWTMEPTFPVGSSMRTTL